MASVGLREVLLLVGGARSVAVDALIVLRS